MEPEPEAWQASALSITPWPLGRVFLIVSPSTSNIIIGKILEGEQGEHFSKVVNVFHHFRDELSKISVKWAENLT